MAHHKAQLKTIKTAEKSRQRNVAVRSQVRTAIKKLLKAVNDNNKEEASKLFTAAQSELANAVRKGIIKKQTASRSTSRLNKKVKNIA